MDALKLVFHPTSDQINSFLPFLKDEYEKNGQGIYCNWKTILSRLKKDQIITLHLNDKPISFVTWYRNDKVVEMEIIWTLPSYRGKGYGYEFQQLLFREFKKRGDVAMTLYCATKDGLSLAKEVDLFLKTITLISIMKIFCLDRKPPTLKFSVTQSHCFSRMKI